MKKQKRKGAESVAILAANLLLIAALIAVVFVYATDYQRKLHQQNLNDIANINQAAANISSQFFFSQETKLKGVLRYLDRNKLTLDELLIYLDDINSSEEISYQLIGAENTGYAIPRNQDGGFNEISYNHVDYDALHKIFEKSIEYEGDDVIAYTAEFTDQITGARSFARYAYVSAYVDGVKTPFTLLAVSNTSSFIDLINIGEGYAELSTVLINNEGDYIFRNSDYKCENFYQYIYLYNNLSLDEMNTLKAELTSSEQGVFTYLNGKSNECVYVYRAIPDSEWYSVSCVPVNSFHNTNYDMTFTIIIISVMVMIMVLDLLWLSEINKRLRKSVREAQTANEAKTDFLSRMSHDIRTPLNVITGMTELALNDEKPNEVKEYLGNIQSSGKFLLGLVNDILDMNKVESGKMELHPKPYRYDEFKTYMNAVIVPLCNEKNLNFTMCGNIGDIVIVVDSLRINQIFFNLLSNAVKFTPSSGHIILKTDSKPIGDNRVMLEMSVKDDGIGMSEKFQRNMFAAFTQEERSEAQNTNGTGLGLAIVKSLIDLMGGTISVKSKIGEGTEFVIHLEAETADEAAKSVNVTNEDALLFGKRILICEDNPLNVQIITHLLERKGIITEKAENGEIGTELFRSKPSGYYDAVLMDIRMPVMNGIDTTKKIRSFKTERADAQYIPIIALTANAYDSDVESCLEAGMTTHLAKPIDPYLLFTTLCECMTKAQQNTKQE